MVGAVHDGRQVGRLADDGRRYVAIVAANFVDVVDQVVLVGIGLLRRPYVEVEE